MFLHFDGTKMDFIGIFIDLIHQYYINVCRREGVFSTFFVKLSTKTSIAVKRPKTTTIMMLPLLWFTVGMVFTVC